TRRPDAGKTADAARLPAPPGPDPGRRRRPLDRRLRPPDPGQPRTARLRLDPDHVPALDAAGHLQPRADRPLRPGLPALRALHFAHPALPGPAGPPRDPGHPAPAALPARDASRPGHRPRPARQDPRTRHLGSPGRAALGPRTARRRGLARCRGLAEMLVRA